MAEGDTLRTLLAALRRLLKVTPINTVALRRKLAERHGERHIVQWMGRVNPDIAAFSGRSHLRRHDRLLDSSTDDAGYVKQIEARRLRPDLRSAIRAGNRTFT